MKLKEKIIPLIIISNMLAFTAFELVVQRDSSDGFGSYTLLLVILLYFVTTGKKFCIIIQLILNSITMLVPVSYVLIRIIDNDQMNYLPYRIILFCSSFVSFLLLLHLIRNKNYVSLRKKYLEGKILKMKSELNNIDNE